MTADTRPFPPAPPRAAAADLRQAPADRAADRDARLKSALRANLARRKAQARARAAATGPADDGDGGADG